jgi:hypothetical protein
VTLAPTQASKLVSKVVGSCTFAAGAIGRTELLRVGDTLHRALKVVDICGGNAPLHRGRPEEDCSPAPHRLPSASPSEHDERRAEPTQLYWVAQSPHCNWQRPARAQPGGYNTPRPATTQRQSAGGATDSPPHYNHADESRQARWGRRGNLCVGNLGLIAIRGGARTSLGARRMVPERSELRADRGRHSLERRRA